MPSSVWTSLSFKKPWLFVMYTLHLAMVKKEYYAEIKHMHKGRYEISWEKFGSLCKELALKIHSDFQPECVVGISKGGLPLATVLASIFRIDLYPVRLSYREMDIGTFSSPQWSVPPTNMENLSFIPNIRNKIRLRRN